MNPRPFRAPGQPPPEKQPVMPLPPRANFPPRAGRQEPMIRKPPPKGE